MLPAQSARSDLPPVRSVLLPHRSMPERRAAHRRSHRLGRAAAGDQAPSWYCPAVAPELGRTPPEEQEHSRRLAACHSARRTGFPHHCQHHNSYRSASLFSLQMTHSSLILLGKSNGSLENRFNGTDSPRDGPCNTRCPAKYGGNWARRLPVAVRSGSSRCSARVRLRRVSRAD